MSNLIKCLKCGKKVSTDIRVCPNCFSNLSNQYRNKTENLELAKQENTRTVVLFLLWLLAIIVILTATAAISGADGDSLGNNLRSVSGWIMLIGGVLITPFLRDFIEEDFGKRVSRTIVNVTGAALSIIGLAGFIFSISVLNKEKAAYLAANPEVVEVKEDSVEAKEPDQPEPIAQEIEEPEIIYSSWEYDNSEDEMRGETSYFASNGSINTVELPFPYQGGTRLNILLRDNAKNGKDIMFIVNKGQIFCGYQDCHVNIKFDDGKVQRYETTEAEAGSSEVLFLTNNISGFVKKLKESTNVTVEVNFYNHGAEQFKFDVSGLEWSRF